MKRLVKSSDRNLCGVCGGVAQYLNCDPTIIRMATVVLSLFSGIGIVAYIIGAILMPDE